MFINFVNGHHLNLYIEARGKEEIAKGAKGVSDEASNAPDLCYAVGKD